MLGDLELFLSSTLNQNVILLGDFNLDLFDAKVVSSSYVEMLNTYAFKWLNTKFPTRESVTTKTCIDHIRVNYLQQSYGINTVSSDVSDHNYILVLDVLEYSTDNTTETVKEVTYKYISPKKVKTKFTEKPFVTDSETANSAAQDLEEYVTEIVDSVKETKRVLNRGKKKYWATDELVNLSKQKKCII